MILDEATLEKVVTEVLTAIRKNAPHAVSAHAAKSHGRNGVFEDAKLAAEAARDGFDQLRAKGVAARRRVVEIVKSMCEANAVSWGAFEFNETKIGNPDHKPGKLQLVRHVPGVEWLHPRGFSGDHGLTMEEYTPFGVIGSILPSTHSIPTLSGNIVNMVAAGNAIVFNPHPGGARSACLATEAFNKAIEHELGIRNLICTIEKPTLESFDAIAKSPNVDILCITGGPAVVKAAMQSGKRAICAGPGNPPVLVDETADIDHAAKSIIEGGSFDNNLLCIGEKAVFVVASVFESFMQALQKHGAAVINTQAVERLTKEAFSVQQGAGGCSHPVLNRTMVGMGAEALAKIAGVQVPAKTPLLVAETNAEHLFVIEEQMMSFMPIVRVRNVAEGITLAKKTEHGYKHSALIHSRNIDNMSAMAQTMDTTLFVKNGPCVAGLGVGGEGYISYSIATTTGEGITNPQTFTRTRRCTMVDNLKIY